jgi:hypothetical protein
MRTRLLVLAALLGVTGWLHGRWTDRWGTAPQVRTAAAALPSVPLVIGEWEGREITREESELVYRSDAPQIVRRYVHRSSGAVVGLLVTCGRPSGMVIEHNPKTCYSELGFEEPAEGRKVPAGPPEARGEFFAHTFVKTTPAATTRLRLLWAWGDGRTWSFPERPRIAFAHAPVLYKIYVTRELLSESEPLADDPVLPFIEAALPEITTALSGGTR